jgi:hypothetical protein
MVRIGEAALTVIVCAHAAGVINAANTGMRALVSFFTF